MKVTSIRTQQRERGRLNIYLDDEYAFSLQAILAARLAVGQELSEAQIAELKANDLVEKAYERTLGYLSYRPRSSDEIRRYLQKRGLEPEAVESIVARLQRSRLIDDRAFAEFWVENRESFRPRGAWALKAELRQKGVNEKIIDSALEDLDEHSSALRAGERAARRYAGLERELFFRRMLSFLQRRGFPYGVCRQVTEHYWEEVQADREPGDGG